MLSNKHLSFPRKRESKKLRLNIDELKAVVLNCTERLHTKYGKTLMVFGGGCWRILFRLRHLQG